MLNVPNSVKLYGGFTGTETNVLQRDIANNPTIIDAQNKYGSVVRLNYYAVLDGFTIQNGNAKHNPHKNGGGVWADDYTVIRNCTIINNATDFNGGGVYAKGPVTMINSVVENNTAMGRGDNTFGSCLTILDNCNPFIAEQPNKNRFLFSCFSPAIALHPNTAQFMPGIICFTANILAHPSTARITPDICYTPALALQPSPNQVPEKCYPPEIAVQPSKLRITN